MKLLVISHTPHYRTGEQLAGWGPTVRELDYLATRVDELVHLAILHPGAAPASALPYRSPNIRLVHLPPAGGNRLLDKAGILSAAPAYWGEINRQLSAADIVQVRCPANISLFALLALIFRRQPHYRWFKYAGNWQPASGSEVFSYRLQRGLLARNWAHGPVAVSGRWTAQPAHIYSVDNPCLTEEEVIQAKRSTAGKGLTLPVHILFIGRVEAAKGMAEALHIVARLSESGAPLVFDIIGDILEQSSFEDLARALGILGQTCFHGTLPRNDLAPFYTRAHFLLHPSHSEGWPKVLSEAMAYGAVPLASDVSSIPQILAEIGCGVALPSTGVDRYVAEILDYLAKPERWQAESQRGQQASGRFTYPAYGAALKRMFENTWGISVLK